MARFSKVLLLVLAIGLVGAYSIDRFYWADGCSDCHSAETRTLPMFGGSVRDGLVRINAASGLQFRVRLAGMTNHGGEAVILLHGFPKTSIMWEPVMKALATAGYRVAAFDQRGYSPDARPGSTHSYAMDQLSEDVVAVANALDFDRFHLVGHDWGAVVGWFVADRYAPRIASWTSISMPHPKAYVASLSEGEDQLRRSAYISFMKLPWLAPFIMGFNRSAFLRRQQWRDVPALHRDEYLRVFGEPGALAAALKWYRAFDVLTPDGMSKIVPPTLYIWGNRDARVGRAGAEMTASFIAGPYRLVKLQAGHSVVDEMPGRVVAELKAMFSRWKTDAEPIAVFDKPLYPEAETCIEAKPACLRLNVKPEGTLIVIENRCDERYRGSIRLQCSSWEEDAVAEYQFDLRSAGVVRHSVRGMVPGNCVYKQRVCVVEAD